MGSLSAKFMFRHLRLHLKASGEVRAGKGVTTAGCFFGGKKAGDTERKEKGQGTELRKRKLFPSPEGEKTGPVNLEAVKRKGLRGVAIAALLSGLTHRCYEQGDEPHPASFLYSCLVHLNRVNFDPSRRI